MSITSNHREYRACTRCIMDTTDPAIEFNAEGVCNHCTKFDKLLAQYPLDQASERKLNGIIDEIRRSGQGKKYDCVIGVSGGVDSTYVAYVIKKQFGLRPLAVHLDNGWNSELAVNNIENCLKKLGIDLHTHVIDWEEFRDIQLSFLKASVSDAEAPTDHGISAILYRVAAAHGVRYIIGGTNVRSEGVMPHFWTYTYVPYDYRYISDIHRSFGEVKVKTYPHFNLFQLFSYVYLRKIRYISILNYVPYVKSDALRIIERELGWRNYGGKHYESIYTRFFQAYILPRKFNIDKRKAHYSALICSGQMTRDEALERMKEPIAPEAMLVQDRTYVIKKFGLTEESFERMMTAPRRTFLEFKSYYRFLMSMKRFVLFLRKYNLFPESW